MAHSKNYYQILDVPSNASVQMIRRAVRDLRRQDHSADFSIIINNIEHVLTDAQERAEYDESIHLPPQQCINYDIMHQFIPLEEQGKGRPKSFLDFGHREEVPEVQASQLKFSPYNRTRADVLAEDSALKFRRSMQPHHIAWLVTLALFCLGGAFAFKPLYQHYLANQQSREALQILKEGSAEIERLIRMHSIFPERLPEHLQPPAEAFYDLSLSGSDRQLTLSFNQNAAPALQRHRLNYNGHHVPNLGLKWYCSASINFPASFVPPSCKSSD